MGIFDKLKATLGGKNKAKTKSGIDKGADVVKGKVGADQAGKVDTAADKAKDVVDKLPD